MKQHITRRFTRSKTATRFSSGELGVKAARKVNMYGVQNIDSRVLTARAMMRLRGLKFDASKFMVTGTAFSNFAALLLEGASLQSRHWELVRKSLKLQGKLLRSECGALTMRPSGPANTPLRSVSAVH